MDTKALRQKILDLAIRGKLVPQDPNDEPASVLLKRIRIEKQQMVKDGRLKAKDVKNDSVIFLGEDNLHYEKFADGAVKCIEDTLPFELPDGWEWAPLSQLYNFIDYRGATPTKVSSGIPLVTAKNVKKGYIDYSIDEYISEAEYQSRQQRGVSRKGDILFTTEAPLGNAAIADLATFSAGQRLITFQQFNHRNDLCNQLFVFFLLSESFQHQLLLRKTGSTVAGIKAAILKTLVLPVPPKQEQVRISEKCLKMLQLVSEIEQNGSDISESIKIAKAHILDLAIRGQLIPQDPTDEPASVLLERIRAEKESLIKQGKIKRDMRESIIFRGEDNSYYETTDGTTECIDEEIPFEIPDNWCFARLESVFLVNPKNDISDDTTVSFVPMTLVDDQYSGQFRFEEKPWKDCKKGFTHFAEGDVGFAKISPCFENRKSAVFSGLLNEYGAGTTELYILRSYCGTILPEFTINFVKSGYFINRGKGTFSGVVGQQRIDKNIVLSTLVPIPPVNEQKRIANRVSEVFVLLDSILSSVE